MRHVPPKTVQTSIGDALVGSFSLACSQACFPIFLSHIWGIGGRWVQIVLPERDHIPKGTAHSVRDMEDFLSLCVPKGKKEVSDLKTSPVAPSAGCLHKGHLAVDRPWLVYP